MTDVLRKLPVYKEFKKEICESFAIYWEKDSNLTKFYKTTEFESIILSI